MSLDLRSLARIRRSKQLSQSDVAARSKTSLATIQNIEAGRANPELATLERIVRSLGLELELRRLPLEWPKLIGLGVPLLAEGKSRIRADRESLKTQILGLSPESLAELKSGRELSALTAWLRALYDHHPSFWSEHASHLNAWISTRELSGPEIKLRRLALAKLAEYI